MPASAPGSDVPLDVDMIDLLLRNWRLFDDEEPDSAGGLPGHEKQQPQQGTMEDAGAAGGNGTGLPPPVPSPFLSPLVPPLPQPGQEGVRKFH